MGWRRPSRGAGGPANRRRRVVARVAALRLLGGRPSPQFRERLRADLMREHATQRSAKTRQTAPAGIPRHGAARPRRRTLLVRLRPVLVFSVLLVAMFGTGVRTYHAVPGEMLYPLKRTAESTVLDLAYDEEDRAERERIAARQRAAEIATLVGKAPPDRRRLIGQTLDDMETTTRAALGRVARRGQAQGEARAFAREQRNLVEPLLPKLDRENRDKANEYLSYINSFTGSGR